MARAKPEKKVRLEYSFGGMKEGSLMYVGTPAVVETYIRSLEHGTTSNIGAMRKRIARQRRCDGMCPVSTSFFLRTVVEAAMEEIADGAQPSAVTPFWRLIAPDDKIVRKLPVDADWLRARRDEEGIRDGR